jgi:hypothetical protein
MKYTEDIVKKLAESEDTIHWMLDEWEILAPAQVKPWIDMAIKDLEDVKRYIGKTENI